MSIPSGGEHRRFRQKSNRVTMRYEFSCSSSPARHSRTKLGTPAGAAPPPITRQSRISGPKQCREVRDRRRRGIPSSRHRRPSEKYRGHLKSTSWAMWLECVLTTSWVASASTTGSVMPLTARPPHSTRSRRERGSASSAIWSSRRALKMCSEPRDRQCHRAASHRARAGHLV